LLAAAATVFGRDGLGGATTRAISKEAGVNEVTLFRLFGSKERLLEAVVGQTFDEPAAPAKPALPKMSGNLRRDLMNYARVYESILARNLPLIRSMLGEIHRHGCQEEKVVKGIFGPLRAEFVSYLRQALKQGKLKKGIAPEMAVDLFGGMIFTGVLRRSSPTKTFEYSAAKYLEGCVEILARGMEARTR
jgi:AcrR family transcriptional regulator